MRIPLIIKRYLFILVILLTANYSYSQDGLPVNTDGRSLETFYLGMNVETHWIARTHVNWETGAPDEPNARQGIATHCSAFVAAACERMNIYILRPPEHGQVLLANAQSDWLNSYAGKKSGWMNVPDDDSLFNKVQQLANSGKVVVAVYKNKDKHKPGHIALVMPAEKTRELLDDEGPDLIMASTHNYNRISLIKGFRSHINGWPTHDVQFFVYDDQAH